MPGSYKPIIIAWFNISYGTKNALGSLAHIYAYGEKETVLKSVVFCFLKRQDWVASSSNQKIRKLCPRH